MFGRKTVVLTITPKAFQVWEVKPSTEAVLIQEITPPGKKFDELMTELSAALGNFGGDLRVLVSDQWAYVTAVSETVLPPTSRIEVESRYANLFPEPLSDGLWDFRLNNHALKQHVVQLVALTSKFSSRLRSILEAVQVSPSMVEPHSVALARQITLEGPYLLLYQTATESLILVGEKDLIWTVYRGDGKFNEKIVQTLIEQAKEKHDLEIKQILAHTPHAQLPASLDGIPLQKIELDPVLSLGSLSLTKGKDENVLLLTPNVTVKRSLTSVPKVIGFVLVGLSIAGVIIFGIIQLLDKSL